MQKPTSNGRSGFRLEPIGYVRRSSDGILLEIAQDFRPALSGLEGFSHALVLWWFDALDSEEHRRTTRLKPPFDAPTLGVFSLRAPMRPNPIAVSTVKLTRIDEEEGVIEVPGIDAYDGTPLLDVKGYLPAFDRVANPVVPEWAAAWPEWMPEDGMDLDEVPASRRDARPPEGQSGDGP